jgi:hypothetical protein
MARLVSTYGHPDPFEWLDARRTGQGLFAAMALHITGQRISAAAAGIPDPDAILPWERTGCVRSAVLGQGPVPDGTG